MYCISVYIYWWQKLQWLPVCMQKHTIMYVETYQYVCRNIPVCMQKNTSKYVEKYVPLCMLKHTIICMLKYTTTYSTVCLHVQLKYTLSLLVVDRKLDHNHTIILTHILYVELYYCLQYVGAYQYICKNNFSYVQYMEAQQSIFMLYKLQD